MNLTTRARYFQNTEVRRATSKARRLATTTVPAHTELLHFSLSLPLQRHQEIGLQQSIACVNCTTTDQIQSRARYEIMDCAFLCMTPYTKLSSKSLILHPGTRSKAASDSSTLLLLHYHRECCTPTYCSTRVAKPQLIPADSNDNQGPMYNKTSAEHNLIH